MKLQTLPYWPLIIISFWFLGVFALSGNTDSLLMIILTMAAYWVIDLMITCAIELSEGDE